MTKILLTAYAVWVLAWVGVTITDTGDAGSSAHLWLTITGFPFSLTSWFLPHASLLAVAVAGLTGLVQWILLAWRLSLR